MDQFLRKHDVDVGRFLAAIAFSGALTRLFGIVGALLAGHLSLDLGVVIGVIIGIGLWQHRSWARLLMVIVTWLAAAFFGALVVLILIRTRLNVTVKFGSTTFTHPTPLQGIVFGCMALPITGLMLAALNSSKTREEFQQRRSADAPSLQPDAGDRS